MTRYWPDTLPGAIEEGYELSPVDQSRRTDMEVGARRLRRITRARRDDVKISWKFTDSEMAAFRAWFGNESWSIAGASGDVSGWTLIDTTVLSQAVAGPGETLADLMIESNADSGHRIQIDLGGPAGTDNVLAMSATLKTYGRNKVRLSLRNRAATLCNADVDLDAGVIESSANVKTATMKDRGDGWWRVTISADVENGGDAPLMRIAALDGSGNSTYAGDGVSGVGVCEVMARIATGYDLFLETDAVGNVLGASGGSGWFQANLAVGGGLRRVEARFLGPYTTQMGEGLAWVVSAPLELRNA